MSEQTYQLQVFVPPRTPIEAANRLVDTLETVANKLADLPYPYEITLEHETTKTIRLAEVVGNNDHSEDTVAAYRKLGVQALKIAHILSEYQIQENTEDE